MTKITIWLFTLSIFSVQASDAFGQKITLNVKNKPLKEFFKDIRKKYDVDFLYTETLIKSARPVTVDVRNKELPYVLDDLLSKQGLGYSISGNTVLVKKLEPETPRINNLQSNQDRIVSGIVLNTDGNAISGVSVESKENSKIGTTTDVKGRYSLAVPAQTTLVFRSVGYVAKEVSIGNRQEVNATLERVDVSVEEVVVVAYGKQRKESIIGAITTMSVKDLKVPVAKISNALAGQMAGIVTVQGSGEPGQGANFWIRGVSTFGSNSTPLILVDGVERPLDLVDPEDVESFSILKDATATAVYGVRGANGIVLVTTKRGKGLDKPIINTRYEKGILQPVRLPKLANAGQWIDYYNDINFEATGDTPFSQDIKDMYLNNADPDLYPNVDWMKAIYKESTTMDRLNLNTTGGSERFKYYVSGSYLRENGLFNPTITKEYNPSINYDKVNFRSNLDIQLSPSTELSLNLSNQYETKNRLGIPLGDMYNMVLSTPNIAIPIVYSDGSPARPSVGRNPYYSLNSRGYAKDFLNNAQSLVRINQDFSNLITRGLRGNMMFSWDAKNGSTVDYLKAPATFIATGRDADGNLILSQNEDGKDYLSLDRSNWGERNTNLEVSLNYDRLFAEKHRIGGLFLFNMRELTNNFPSGYIYAFPYRNMGIASRATYSYADRYFIEGNFGYNGSENFSPGKRFGFFPSLALGYILSNERYFKPISPVVHFLKIRGSIGEIGSDKIGGNARFGYNSEMANTGGYHFGSTGQKWVNGIATGRPGNPNIVWESALKRNIGMELGLFNKFVLIADYFTDYRRNIFLQQGNVPSIVGLNERQFMNLGRMKNQGVDASLEFTHRSGDFGLQLRGNFTYNKNEIIYNDTPTPIWAYQSVVGYRFGQQRGLIATGLFESQEDIDNTVRHNFTPVKPGDVKYKDINDDGVIDSYDKVAIGHTNIPDISYGFGFSMSYKGADFSSFFHGVGRVTRIIGGGPLSGMGGNILTYGQIYSDVADNRWSARNPNVDALYPRMSLTASENNSQASTLWQRDMSFLRLKNIEVGYTLPKTWTSKFKINGIRLYAQGQNVLTFSKFKLWDPELNTDSGGIYPQMRVVNFGVNIIM